MSASVLKEVPLPVEVTGSYAALTQFLTQIEGLQRSMLVTDVSVTKEGAEAEDGTLTLSLGASVFMTSDQVAAPATTVPTPVADAATTTE